MELDNINNNERIFGVLLVRVSTLKQFQEGCSLNDQVLQCRHFASGRGIR